MQKIREIIKPFIAIIFGALFFLMFFNLLAATGAYLALGIIATIFAAYYLAIGIVGFILGSKMPEPLKKIFDAVSAGLFPLFVFLNTLLMIIANHEYIGPAGWIIAVVGLMGSLTAAGLCPVAVMVKNKLLVRLGFFAAALFSLVLLMNILFALDGTPMAIGAVSIVGLAVSLLFVSMLFALMTKPEKEEKAKEE